MFYNIPKFLHIPKQYDNFATLLQQYLNFLFMSYTLNSYQERAMSTCMPSSDNFAYMALGLTGELGELSSLIAKAIRHGIIRIEYNELVFTDKATSEEKDDIIARIKGELGDHLWFVAGLSHTMGYTLQEIGEININKLASRQQRGVIEGNGDFR